MMETSEETPLEHLHLTVGSTFENLEALIDRLEDFAGEHIGDEDRTYRVVLAASEAVTNAMKHGNDFDPEKMTTLECFAFEDRLEISVEDEGGGFERDRVKNPLDEENLMEPSGRGIYIIETVADEVSYERAGRRVRMTFKRS